MAIKGAQETITSTVTTWEGVEARPHRFGGVEYGIGKREIGHIHGDHMVDIPFPKRIRDEVIAASRAQPHHLLPETGWISFYIHEEADIEQAIALLQESYEVALKQKRRSS